MGSERRQPSYDFDCDDRQEPGAEGCARAEPSRDEGARRKVRVRTTIGGNEGESRKPTVFCPLLRRSLSLGDCARCEVFEDLALDPGGEPFVLCRSAYFDAARRSASLSERANPSLTPVTELVKEQDVVCIRPDVDMEEIAKLFVEKGLSFVAVVGEKSEPLGVVSQTDLVREHQGRDAPATAGEIMTPLVWKLPESATLDEAIALMTAKGVRQIPIVSGDGDLVGVLSALDIVRWLAGLRGKEPAP